MSISAIKALFKELSGKIASKPPKKTDAEKAKIKAYADRLFGTEDEIMSIGRAGVTPLRTSGKLSNDEFARLLINRKSPPSDLVLSKIKNNDALLDALALQTAKKIENSKSGVGGLVAAGLAKDTDKELLKKIGIGIGLGGVGAADMYDKTEGFTEDYNPRNAFYGDMFDNIGSNMSPIVDQKIEGDKIIRTHKDGSISVIPKFEGDDEPIQPVSLLFAQGGPAMSDNEPRMEDRSPNNQMFSIESAINNLMTEYDMVVQNQDFQRAQMIADQIDQLQQQKIGIQSQMGDQQMSQAMMGESGRTPSNQDTDQISRILESISI